MSQSVSFLTFIVHIALQLAITTTARVSNMSVRTHAPTIDATISQRVRTVVTTSARIHHTGHPPHSLGGSQHLCLYINFHLCDIVDQDLLAVPDRVRQSAAGMSYIDPL